MGRVARFGTLHVMCRVAGLAASSTGKLRESPAITLSALEGTRSPTVPRSRFSLSPRVLEIPLCPFRYPEVLVQSEVFWRIFINWFATGMIDEVTTPRAGLRRPRRKCLEWVPVGGDSGRRRGLVLASGHGFIRREGGGEGGRPPASVGYKVLAAC